MLSTTWNLFAPSNLFMKIYFLILLLLVTILCTSCVKETVADSISEVESTQTPQVFKAEAKISSGDLKDVRTSQTVFNQKENNSKIYFVDKDNGWLIGKILSKDRDIITSNLYKTQDGGKTWANVPIKVEKDANLQTICFVNQTVGWLNIQKIGDVNKNDTKSWLMKTSDGGKSWQNLVTNNFTEINNIYFLDEKNGWLIGETNNPENVYDSKQFLKTTRDGGNTWTEIGNELFEKNDFSDARQIITGFIAETPNNLKVVMWSGKLFQSADAGKTWQQFGPQFKFPPQTTPDNFGKLGNSNRLRMARGTWSIEGIYSYIATEKNGDWTIHWTDEALCIYDILFLSENEMIAVGRLGTDIYEKNESIDGVIIYSSDGGENWKTVYRNKLISEINSIARISENHFMAVGNKGLLVNIEFEKSRL